MTIKNCSLKYHVIPRCQGICPRGRKFDQRRFIVPHPCVLKAGLPIAEGLIKIQALPHWPHWCYCGYDTGLSYSSQWTPSGGISICYMCDWKKSSYTSGLISLPKYGLLIVLLLYYLDLGKDQYFSAMICPMKSFGTYIAPFLELGIRNVISATIEIRASIHILVDILLSIGSCCASYWN